MGIEMPGNRRLQKPSGLTAGPLMLTAQRIPRAPMLRNHLPQHAGQQPDLSPGCRITGIYGHHGLPKNAKPNATSVGAAQSGSSRSIQLAIRQIFGSTTPSSLRNPARDDRRRPAPFRRDSSRSRAAAGTAVHHLSFLLLRKPSFQVMIQPPCASPAPMGAGGGKPIPRIP